MVFTDNRIRSRPSVGLCHTANAVFAPSACVLCIYLPWEIAFLPSFIYPPRFRFSDRVSQAECGLFLFPRRMWAVFPSIAECGLTLHRRMWAFIPPVAELWALLFRGPNVGPPHSDPPSCGVFAHLYCRCNMRCSTYGVFLPSLSVSHASTFPFSRLVVTFDQFSNGLTQVCWLVPSSPIPLVSES